MALMQLTIIPLGTSGPGVGEHIAEIQRILRKTGVPHSLTDMGTVIEGEPQALLALAAQLHEVPFRQGLQRVVTHISLDDRRDRRVGLGDKIASVENRMG